MATYKLPNGKPVSDDMAFTWDEIQYPRNWIKLSTQEQRDAIGLEGPLPAPPWYDQQFYWGYDADGALIPKDHAQLVEQWVAHTKAAAGSLLTPFDWYIVRETETGKAVPQAVLEYRAAVRVVSDNREVMIRGTSDTKQLAAVITGNFGGMFAWPRDPFAPELVADESGEPT